MHVQSGGTLLSPSMLAIEIASRITRATGQPGLAHLAVRNLYSLSLVHIVPMDEQLVNRTAVIAADYKLKGADAPFVALADLEAVPLLSFDHAQLTRPADLITTLRP
ncbi:MAG: PIN domain-containing protein [Chloroflexota bacterium]|nr:PIN domain-containing protein [Chloroflexota bacterium]